MSAESKILIRFPGGRRVDAALGAHVVHTDQPVSKGGEDSAPSPFDLFLAAIGTCAGIFVQGFCAQRNIPVENLQLVERPEYGADGVLVGVDLALHLPPEFPERYREAILRVVEQCSVKRAIAAQPVFRVHAEPSPAAAEPAALEGAHV